jgi:hypothetical protein
MTTVKRDYETDYAKLLHEFNEYCAEHMELYEELPDRATLIITDRTDAGVTDYSWSLIESSKEGWPIVEVEKIETGWKVHQPLTTLA